MSGLRVTVALGVACLLSVLASPPGFAFDTGHHQDVTRTVLDERGFDKTAIEIAQIYNWLTDYYSSSPTSKTPIQGAREVKADLEQLHFDNRFTAREIEITWGWLLANFETATREAARDQRPEQALILLGIALHTGQDFYSHSNWVETHPRPADGRFRCETYPAAGLPPRADLYTGWYANSGFREQDRLRTQHEKHGDYEQGLNKDSHVRPLWDEAYVFSYCASHELVAAMERWAEDERPGFWQTIRGYTYGTDGTLSGSLDDVRSKKIEMSLKAVHDLSMWVAGTAGADGHWKGNRSGSKRFFFATSAEYVARGRRQIGKAILKETLHRKLATNLYASVPPAATPKIEPYALDRRAVIVRVSRIAEKEDRKEGERRIDRPAISGKPDYYARITIDGQPYLDRTLQDTREFDGEREGQDAWVAMHFVDGTVAEVPIEIEVWDEDDTSEGGAYKNAQADINPAPGRRSIRLRYRLTDGSVSGDVEQPSATVGSTIAVAGELPDRYRAEITFTVSHASVANTPPIGPETKTVTPPARPPWFRRPGPFADLSNSLGTTTALPVRGRLVKEKQPVDPDEEIPRSGARQDELKRATVRLVTLDVVGADLLTLGTAVSDKEGYIDTVLSIEPGRLAPGRYAIDVRYEGKTIGRLRAHLLAEDDRGLAIRSDVDMTYLDTDLGSTRAKVDLVNYNARERAALPGMAAVYRALRSGADGESERPLLFISGSPRFFKRMLEARLELDGIDHDGLTLKPYKSIAWTSKFKPWKIVSKLEEQVGYKLHALLRGRIEMPPGMGEILMGDDTEADATIYTLYHRFTSRQISPDELRARLVELEVEPFWRDRIDPLLPRVLDRLDTPSPVKAIYINRTRDDDGHDSADPVGLPEILLYHAGAAPLIRDLAKRGLVPESAIAEVDASVISP